LMSRMADTHRTPRCDHGMAPGLCVVPGCPHAERSGPQASAPRVKPKHCHRCRRAVPSINADALCPDCDEQRAQNRIARESPNGRGIGLV
jgi:hypothetical protein